MTQEIQDEFETFHSDINELSIAYLFDNDNIVSKNEKIVPIQKHEFHF
jgi:mitochondrial fission protein ELM1